MSRFLILLAVIVPVAIVVMAPFLVAQEYVMRYGPVTILDTTQAVLLCCFAALPIGILAYKSGSHGRFLVRIFLAALLLRMLVGSSIFVFQGQRFFGGDAFTYDFFGYLQVKAWGGDQYARTLIHALMMKAAAPWGMVYYVALVYELVGRNMLAVQFLNAVLGAATAPIIFHCAHLLTNNSKVAQVAAFGVAFTPSLVLWSSQELKDGPIMFFLALSMLATMKLGEKLSVKFLVALVFALISILAFRFYVFYMLLAAIAAAFLIGMRSTTPQSLVRQLIVIALLGVSLTYFGVQKYANAQLGSYGSLEAIQLSRSQASQSAVSGFARTADVSTVEGAANVIPVGMLNLLFAPFPWQLASFRQSITIPEMFVWWASFPLLVMGLWYLIRYRLRQVSPVLIFTGMLSLTYSVFQGNVGNAYRERAQLLVFYLIFVAVGYVLMRERSEDKRASADPGPDKEC